MANTSNWHKIPTPSAWIYRKIGGMTILDVGGMTNREKLIKALRACAEHTNCRECPAFGCGGDVACYDSIVLEAAHEIEYLGGKADEFVRLCNEWREARMDFDERLG